MPDIEIISGGAELLDRVVPLWNELRAHHASIAGIFSNEIAERTFAERSHELTARRSQLLVEIACRGTNIAYCISSVSVDVGEVDSLYVKPEYRSQGLGAKLIESALRWMDERHVEKKVVSVLATNVEALAFYERFGFERRSVILEQGA